MTHKVEIKKNEKLTCDIAFFSNTNCTLDSSYNLENFKIAYKSFGKLNKNKNNVILVCHALSGDQFVTGKNPITNKDGWWARTVGPNKPIDTNKYFVICTNVLGGCAGSTGPKEINAMTNSHFGTDFPSITIRDMVKVQKYLIDALNIEKIFTVVGGSMGAMQVLQWTIDYPDKLENAIHIAGALIIAFISFGPVDPAHPPRTFAQITKYLFVSIGLSRPTMRVHHPSLLVIGFFPVTN